VDVLQAAGARVHLAHPLGVKGFAYRRVIPEVSMDGVRPRTMKMGGCLATTPAAAWCPVGPF
jgi:hypothetical protein